VRQAIADADEIRTPDVVLAEISRKYLREKVEEAKVRSRLQTVRSTTLVSSVDIEVAMQAGRAFLELAEKARRQKRKPPSLFDAIVLATARVYDSKVITGDEHFQELPETIPI
jgi:predicted nucleic acid-binding protein